MNVNVEKRINQINKAESSEELKKYLCPFFSKGGYSGCLTCKCSDADLEECKDYYLERILMHPMDLWCEEFDTAKVQSRKTVPLENIIGVGSNCDNCYIYDKCPLYKKGYACAIEWGSNKPKTPSEFMDFLINTQYERVRRAAVFEKLDGGVPDAGLSGEMDRLTDYLNTKDNMGRDRLSINVEASGAARPAGGILSKIFGGEPKAISETSSINEPIEMAEYQEIKAEPKKITRNRKKNGDNS